jgi:hypothetical protein
MAMYKLTYIDLGRNKEMKEVFPDREHCTLRKKFLRSYPKGVFGKLTMTEINDGYHISYSLLGTEEVPDQWRYGEVVRYKTVPKWYDGYEDWVETEKEMRDLIEEKKSFGNRTYSHFIVEHIVNGEVVATFNY